MRVPVEQVRSDPGATGLVPLGPEMSFAARATHSTLSVPTALWSERRKQGPRSSSRTTTVAGPRTGCAGLPRVSPPVCELTAQNKQLTMGGFERGPQFGDLFPVFLADLGQLLSEAPDQGALGRVGVGGPV